QHRRPQPDGEQDIPHFAHLATSYWVKNNATNIASSAREVVTSAMKLGTSNARLIPSAPTNMAATNSAATITPMADRLASIATTMPVEPNPGARAVDTWPLTPRTSTAPASPANRPDRQATLISVAPIGTPAKRAAAALVPAA